MKKFFSIVAVAAFLCSCEQIKALMEPKGDSGSTSSSSSNYDPVASLKGYVMPNIKMAYVDVAKAAEGSSATRDMGNDMTSTVAVVGKKDGKTVVELTASYMKDYASNKPAVVALLVDSSGKVHKAWGGLAGSEGVELPVPEEKPAQSGEKADVKIEDIADVTVVGMKGDGKKYTTKHGTSKSWTNPDFAFFGGVLQTEAGASKTVVSEYKKSGAKAQLTIK